MTTEAVQTVAEGLEALRAGAGFAPLEDVGWIAVMGSDRVRWLNGMVTNSVQALKVGQGAYTFLLNAQGRIQGDATMWCSSEDLLLLETDLQQLEPMMELLDRFIIMDDVELKAFAEEWKGVRVAGPNAPAALERLGLPTLTEDLAKESGVPWRGRSLTLIRGYGPVVPRFEVWSRNADAVAEIVAALQGAGVTQVEAESFELLRVVESVPRFGVDIRDRDLPQETAQTRALHFSKGCYLGQEIVERIRSRGQVHRTFAQFALTGDPVAPGAELLAEDKPVGVLTTVANEPVNGARLALGYVRREALERRLPLSYPGGTAAVRVEAPGAPSASNA
ncbi:MAG: folate-binding protein [Terriglobus roseus]|nr:folate-binding protein [Terriglobus roseus]